MQQNVPKLSKLDTWTVTGSCDCRIVVVNYLYESPHCATGSPEKYAYIHYLKCVKIISVSYHHVLLGQIIRKKELFVNFYDVGICQYGGWIRCSNERVNVKSDKRMPVTVFLRLHVHDRTNNTDTGDCTTMD